MSTVDGWDATHDNVAHAPAGQGAGYTTGTPDIQWTQQDWEAHPGAVRICQDAQASDATADALDVESGAAGLTKVPGWVRRAWKSFDADKRPGQRTPAVYISASRVLELHAVLDAAGLRGKCALWIAHWGTTHDHAVEQVQAARPPWIMAGFQWTNGPQFDQDVWSKAWLDDVSGASHPAPPPVPTLTLEDIVTKLPELREGDSGKAVRTLQGLLAARYMPLGDSGRHHDGIDGNFGPVTAAAVRQLQGQHSLAQDGIAGPRTWLALAAV